MDTASNATQPRTVKEYAYNISAAAANAILVTLGFGLLLQSLGNMTGMTVFTQLGTLSNDLLAPALGVAVASQLGVNTLVIFSSMIAATVGSNAVHFTTAAVNGVTATGSGLAQAAGSASFSTGQPVSAVGAALIAALVGKYLTGKTPLDMVLVPFGASGGGVVAGLGLAYVTTPMLLRLSAFIASSMQANAVVGSMCVAVVWGLFVLTPASSAALAIALTLDPVSSGAALIGTTVQFVAFFAMSWRQNKAGANVAQLLVTPKVQFPNLLVNPWLLVPPMVATVVCAPIAVAALNFQVSYKLAGLGLNSLIAPLALVTGNFNAFVVYVVFGMLVPVVITMVVYTFMKRLGMVAAEQMHLEIV